MRALVVIFLLTVTPAGAQLRNAAELHADATKQYVEALAKDDKCSASQRSDEIEDIAARSADWMAPGFVNWVTGKRSEIEDRQKRRLGLIYRAEFSLYECTGIGKLHNRTLLSVTKHALESVFTMRWDN
ncbi:hypothetical protein [Oceaniglobus trochenteri]|uniref:hypothetical protein n=1 Tax=Oceaniglobus trochenteri TaxID=2763260 RepID=UPI001CFF6EC7|nr:hypothetical protein [Oceaniglobus trochenteri]